MGTLNRHYILSQGALIKGYLKDIIKVISVGIWFQPIAKPYWVIQAPDPDMPGISAMHKRHALHNRHAYTQFPFTPIRPFFGN